MIQSVANSAPHGSLIYFRNDVHPVMQLAGDNADCIAYLMGNHTIAEQMFRHDPRAMLHSPLHTVIWEDSTGAARFSADQPRRSSRASASLRFRRSVSSWIASRRRFSTRWTSMCRALCSRAKAVRFDLPLRGLPVDGVDMSILPSFTRRAAEPA